MSMEASTTPPTSASSKASVHPAATRAGGLGNSGTVQLSPNGSAVLALAKWRTDPLARPVRRLQKYPSTSSSDSGSSAVAPQATAVPAHAQPATTPRGIHAAVSAGAASRLGSTSTTPATPAPGALSSKPGTKKTGASILKREGNSVAKSVVRSGALGVPAIQAAIFKQVPPPAPPVPAQYSSHSGSGSGSSATSSESVPESPPTVSKGFNTTQYRSRTTSVVSTSESESGSTRATSPSLLPGGGQLAHTSATPPSQGGTSSLPTRWAGRDAQRMRAYQQSFVSATTNGTDTGPPAHDGDGTTHGHAPHQLTSVGAAMYARAAHDVAHLSDARPQGEPGGSNTSPLTSAMRTWEGVQDLQRERAEEKRDVTMSTLSELRGLVTTPTPGTPPLPRFGMGGDSMTQGLGSSMHTLSTGVRTTLSPPPLGARQVYSEPKADLTAENILLASPLYELHRKLLSSAENAATQETWRMGADSFRVKSASGIDGTIITSTPMALMRDAIFCIKDGQSLSTQIVEMASLLDEQLTLLVNAPVPVATDMSVSGMLKWLPARKLDKYTTSLACLSPGELGTLERLATNWAEQLTMEEEFLSGVYHQLYYCLQMAWERMMKALDAAANDVEAAQLKFQSHLDSVNEVLSYEISSKRDTAFRHSHPRFAGMVDYNSFCIAHGLLVFEDSGFRMFEDLKWHWKENQRILVQRRVLAEMTGGQPTTATTAEPEAPAQQPQARRARGRKSGRVKRGRRGRGGKNATACGEKKGVHSRSRSPRALACGALYSANALALTAGAGSHGAGADAHSGREWHEVPGNLSRQDPMSGLLSSGLGGFANLTDLLDADMRAAENAGRAKVKSEKEAQRLVPDDGDDTAAADPVDATELEHVRLLKLVRDTHVWADGRRFCEVRAEAAWKVTVGEMAKRMEATARSCREQEEALLVVRFKHLDLELANKIEELRAEEIVLKSRVKLSAAKSGHMLRLCASLLEHRKPVRQHVHRLVLLRHLRNVRPVGEQIVARLLPLQPADGEMEDAEVGLGGGPTGSLEYHRTALRIAEARGLVRHAVEGSDAE